MKYLKRMSIILVSIILIFYIFYTLTKPSNDREWNTDQAVLPSATIDGDLIHIKNIRNFSYTSTTEYTPAYYNKTFDLSQLERVWYIVEPFNGHKGSAHTMVSFEFSNPDGAQNDFVSISVEIRKEVGETFSAIKGLFNRYELMYVIADERDVINLRANHRRDEVYMYPIKSSQESAQKFFLSMINRANTLREKPEFYNTLTNTCTTNLVDHLNELHPDTVPFSYKTILPAYSAELAYDLGMIDVDADKDFKTAQKQFLINEKAELFINSPLFSSEIRKRN